MNTTTHTDLHTGSLVSRPRQLLATVRDELRERRQARAEERALERDLAAYSTPSEVDELLTIMGDAEGPDADRVRTILARNLQIAS
jgi:hypothetical protein